MGIENSTVKIIEESLSLDLSGIHAHVILLPASFIVNTGICMQSIYIGQKDDNLSSYHDVIYLEAPAKKLFDTIVDVQNGMVEDTIKNAGIYSSIKTHIDLCKSAAKYNNLDTVIILLGINQPIPFDDQWVDSVSMVIPDLDLQDTVYLYREKVKKSFDKKCRDKPAGTKAISPVVMSSVDMIDSKLDKLTTATNAIKCMYDRIEESKRGLNTKIVVCNKTRISNAITNIIRTLLSKTNTTNEVK